MKLINQTGLNCWSACIAALLELDEKEVPDFCNIEPVDDWFDRTVRWLCERGIGILMIELEGKKLPDALVYARAKWIVTGKANRECGCARMPLHAVVYSGADVWWDPHSCYREIGDGGLEPDSWTDGAILFPLNDIHECLVK